MLKELNRGGNVIVWPSPEQIVDMGDGNFQAPAWTKGYSEEVVSFMATTHMKDQGFVLGHCQKAYVKKGVSAGKQVIERKNNAKCQKWNLILRTR